ncbi:response regulator [Vulgatibacter incomptus]|uniref:histidine kinase n=1 Tax=Vulgatibacter incomptus TaxID=1391653 RepID=A0A0K1P882_9BACT|nr:response regulator [Vulgatibacter incomptus]AKU89720.1 Chemotaxis protein methyltransferase CheR [Vulgatibacter incomptus]
MLPGEGQLDRAEQTLVDFLREEAERIARFAARFVTEDLPVGGTGTRRRLRITYQAQVEELARHLELYGSEAPVLYGESQRRHAARHVSQGVSMSNTLEERAKLHRGIIEVWELRHGPLPSKVAQLLAATLSETLAQAADVYLAFQRSEGAAFQEAALLETIVGHLDEAILVVERDGLVSYATPVLEELLGYAPRLFVGVHLDKISGLIEKLNFRDPSGAEIDPDDVPHQVVLRTLKPSALDAVLVRRADGSDAVVEIHAAPVFDEDGDLRGAVETIRDRTESFRQTRALEASFRERREMHARLLERTRLEAVGSLAKSAAHALNNELNVITLRLRRLQDVPDASEEAESIERSVREIAALVGRLQEFAAVPTRGEPVPLDAGRVLAEALAMVRPEFDGRQVDVAAEIGELGTVVGDEETLLTLLTAVLAGARDATPTGGTVELEATRDEEGALIRVIEHGPELTEEDVAKLFEPLAAGVEERALSLSAGRDAVMDWGGSLEVHAEPDVGNVFEIRLPSPPPKEEEEEAPPAPAPAARPAAHAAHRVLVVDDDPDNAAMLADLVEGANAEAVTAGTGEEALEKAASEHPDAALVDLLLPDMKGWDVVRSLRKIDSELRIAVVSGLTVGKQEKERGLADDVFRKPIDTDDVLHFLGL